MFVDTLKEFLFNPDYEKSILVQNNFLVCGIVISYIMFVKFLGPLLMKQRNAWDLYYFIILFNIMIIIWNTYISLSAWGFVIKYWNYRCNLKHHPDFKNDLKVYGYLAWQGLLIKMVELTDTVIFVLRKKDNQASFFHVFHHSIVVVLCWVVLSGKRIEFKFILIGAVNTFIHSLTYTYYCLSVIGPGVRKHLWWKKYLTMIQLLQFICAIIYVLHNFLTGCEELDAFEKMSACIIFFIGALLLKFYFKSYYQKEEKRK